MKRCLLSLAAAACLFLASCSFQSGSELLDSSLLAAPVPEELTQSELWQQAVHSGSLISYEEEPITTKAMAEEATASLAKKGGTVEMYQFSGSGDTAACTRILCKNTGEEITLPCDGLFISVGRKPATELAEGQLKLDPSGYIVAGETTKTSLPGVYAVGDVRTKPLRQVVTAVADGATAVHMAEEYLAGGN